MREAAKAKVTNRMTSMAQKYEALEAEVVSLKKG